MQLLAVFKRDKIITAEDKRKIVLKSLITLAFAKIRSCEYARKPTR